MKTILPRILVALLVACAIARPAAAQNATTTGAIRGLVRGPNREPLANATVTGRDASTGLTREAQTNARGEYVLALLRGRGHLARPARPRHRLSHRFARSERNRRDGRPDRDGEFRHGARGSVVLPEINLGDAGTADARRDRRLRCPQSVGRQQRNRDAARRSACATSPTSLPCRGSSTRTRNAPPAASSRSPACGRRRPTSRSTAPTRTTRSSARIAAARASRSSSRSSRSANSRW